MPVSRTRPARTRDPSFAAVLALTLLEVIRDMDFPGEVLEEEDPALTMPRRLGLSEVVERQIHRYRRAVRRRRRIPAAEARDLFGLVIRRPDSEEVFLRAGRILGRRGRRSRRLGSVLPRRLRARRARRRIRKRIAHLFGQPLGGFGPGLFSLEARGHVLLDFDPGGEACALVTGLAEALLRWEMGGDVEVVHRDCEGRGATRCRWVARTPERGAG